MAVLISVLDVGSGTLRRKLVLSTCRLYSERSKVSLMGAVACARTTTRCRASTTPAAPEPSAHQQDRVPRHGNDARTSPPSP
eukprot:2983536-Pyramimonas_sp.AAC.1